MESIDKQKKRITDVLLSFGVECDYLRHTVGPTTIFYEFLPKIGSRLSRLKNYMDDIALGLGGSVRIVWSVSGKGTIGIEMPHDNPQVVSFHSIVQSTEFQNSNYALPIALGKNSLNENCVIDLVKQPHLLIAGRQGVGKTECLHTIIYSLLKKEQAENMRFVLMTKRADLMQSHTSVIENYLTKTAGQTEAIIADVSQAVKALESLCVEMDNRFDLLCKLKCRSIDECHQFPYIIVIIDEYADFLMAAGKIFEQPLCRIAQLGRAIGIHLVITTQRATTNIISGTIKANFPVRIAFQTCCVMDSRTIIDRQGAESLLGSGDMLLCNGIELTRIQGALVDEECQLGFIQSDFSKPYILPPGSFEYSDYDDEEEDMDSLDPLFEDVARLIIQLGRCSYTMISESFTISNVRAAKIMRQLENAGIIEYKVNCLTDKELENIIENDLIW